MNEVERIDPELLPRKIGWYVYFAWGATERESNLTSSSKSCKCTEQNYSTTTKVCSANDTERHYSTKITIFGWSVSTLHATSRVGWSSQFLFYLRHETESSGAPAIWFLHYIKHGLVAPSKQRTSIQTIHYQHLLISWSFFTCTHHRTCAEQCWTSRNSFQEHRTKWSRPTRPTCRTQHDWRIEWRYLRCSITDVHSTSISSLWVSPEQRCSYASKLCWEKFIKIPGKNCHFHRTLPSSSWTCSPWPRKRRCTSSALRQRMLRKSI